MRITNTVVSGYLRPGKGKIHTFRSRVLALTVHPDGKRLIAATERGAYISNAAHTRWRKIPTA